MRVTVMGAGRVGLTTAIALEYLGHKVAIVDRDERLIENLRRGELPFHEPGLASLWSYSRIQTATQLSPEHLQSDVLLIAVGTPGLPDGRADTSAVEAVARDMGRQAPQGADLVVAVKSTVPPGTTDRVQDLIDAELRLRGVTARIGTASNPEFLREGCALSDTLYPDRIVIGASDPDSAVRLLELYSPIIHQQFPPPEGTPRPEGYTAVPVLEAQPVDAELTKYGANAFLATKLSFVNELARLAEALGADIGAITTGIGYDPRIGPHYMKAGPGWGGPCLGKDARALVAMGAEKGCDMSVTTAALATNARQREHLVERLEAALGTCRGATIGILGLSFKEGTDDVADSPALDVASLLLARGATVRCYDPMAEPRAQRERPDLSVQYHTSIDEMIDGCEALVVMTDWDQFRHLPWAELAKTMRRRTVLDARNILDRLAMEQAGFTYLGVGR
jgi:UDPglucose 6-dehydrogenase